LKTVNNSLNSNLYSFSISSQTALNLEIGVMFFHSDITFLKAFLYVVAQNGSLKKVLSSFSEVLLFFFVNLLSFCSFLICLFSIVSIISIFSETFS